MYTIKDNSLMKVNGLSCVLHMPKAVEKKFHNGEEIACQLPPYNARTAYVVDEYPAAPEVWMNGSDKASSYFVPIEANHGLWLDFNGNANHTHDVAVVVSIQGINPITGKKSEFNLEQYRKQCPIHNVEFGQDLFCKPCGYKWPYQNYLATTGTPSSLFWLDGFRSEDGVVRQYLFTEEECKGIASQIIKKDRVFAIGIAFYLSKHPKPTKPSYYSRGPMAGNGPIMGSDWTKSKQFTMHDTKYSQTISSSQSTSKSWPVTQSCNSSDEVMGCSFEGAVQDYMPASEYNREADFRPGRIVSRGAVPPIRSRVESKKMEIGAGAKISQAVYKDPKELDYWDTTPAGFIYINYCDSETANQILKAGKRQDKNDGFMSGLNLAK